MGRWLEKFSGGRLQRLVFEGKAATAARAMRAENRHLPVIEVTYTLRFKGDDKRSGQQVDEVKLYLDLEDAIKLSQEMLHAIAAASPRLPRAAIRSPFDN